MDSNLAAFLAVLAVTMGAACALQPPQYAPTDVAPAGIRLPQEAYWNSELPNTPMPKAIRDILPTGLSTNDEKMSIPNREYKVYKFAGNQVSDDEDWSLYFRETYLRPGKTMNLHFIKSTNPESFVSRKVVESMPFSTIMLSEIFRRYSVKPGSVEAKKINSTINRCLGPGSISTEDKGCATSLESMVDFATTRLGNNVETFTTKVEGQPGKQEYTIQFGMKKLGGDKFVVCHKLHYPHAIFYCHSFKTTEAYAARVPLRGSNGSTAQPLMICHTKTAEWDPNYHPLKMLNIKPGTIPLCHFLAQDSIVYIPRD